MNIPPKGDRGQEADDEKRKGQSVLGIVVDRIECTDAKVAMETSKPGKKPLEFAIKSLVLIDVGAKKPLNYEALLVNPKPVGDVQSTGHFGPWQNDNPRDTPLDGNYKFTHADLSSIHGLGGILSSTGNFGGTLGNLTVEGMTDTPDFRLDFSDHPVPLHAEFHAVVDGTTGDTRLDPVRARLGRTEITATEVGYEGGGRTGAQYRSQRGDREGPAGGHAEPVVEVEPAADAGGLAAKMHILRFRRDR